MTNNANPPLCSTCPRTERLALLAQRRCSDGDAAMYWSLLVDDLGTADERASSLGSTENTTASTDTVCNNDLCLADIVRRSLHESSYTHLRHIECSCREGVVLLHGRVPTYYLKQVAQELVRPFACVQQVVNSIEVDNNQ
jgi:osmotically-inducible protein OsmY